MTLSNQPGGATAPAEDLRFRHVESPRRPTDLPVPARPDVEDWQRAIERVRTPGESVPLERVIERLDEQSDVE